MSIITALVLETAVEAKKTEAKDVRAVVFLIPVGLCLFSMLIAAEFPTFAGAIAFTGLE